MKWRGFNVPLQGRELAQMPKLCDTRIEVTVESIRWEFHPLLLKKLPVVTLMTTVEHQIDGEWHRQPMDTLKLGERDTVEFNGIQSALTWALQRLGRT